MDRIILKGMAFYGFHGVREEERRKGQVFTVDVAVGCDLRQAGRTDRLEDTIDYGELFREVRAVLEGPPKNLLEAVAEEIAQRLLSYDGVREVHVEVHKPHVHLRDGILEHAAVHVERRRADLSQSGIGY